MIEVFYVSGFRSGAYRYRLQSSIWLTSCKVYIPAQEAKAWSQCMAVAKVMAFGKYHLFINWAVMYHPERIYPFCFQVSKIVHCFLMSQQHRQCIVFIQY